MCNEATVECKTGHFKAVGAPTEAALVVLAEKLGVPNANEANRLRSLRANDPEGNPTPASNFYTGRSATLSGLRDSRPAFHASVSHKAVQIHALQA